MKTELVNVHESLQTPPTLSGTPEGVLLRFRRRYIVLQERIIVVITVTATEDANGFMVEHVVNPHVLRVPERMHTVLPVTVVGLVLLHQFPVVLVVHLEDVLFLSGLLV